LASNEMGASHSRSEADDKVFQNETPISLSRDVVNQLANRLESPETSPERQSTLDALVRSRIKNELERLKQEEDDVRQQIENALEKENLDRERSIVEGDWEVDKSAEGRIPSSAVLLGDLEEIQSKVDKYHRGKDLTKFPEVKAAGEAVASCYKAHSATPLECWREVENFKFSILELERQHFKSLQ